MSVKPNFGGKDIPLVFKGSQLIYPSYAKDGLALHYDFSGMTNTDTNKDIATDLSGNGNDGTLQNFNYTTESGYDKNRLLFDGVDDKLQIPELNLDETGMTVGIDGKVYAYEDDKVVTVGRDGDIVGSGINLIINSDFKNNFEGWNGVTNVELYSEKYKGLSVARSFDENTDWTSSKLSTRLIHLPVNEDFIVSFYGNEKWNGGNGAVSNTVYFYDFEGVSTRHVRIPSIFSGSNTWEKMEYIFSLNEGEYWIGIEFGYYWSTPTGEFLFTSPKLEKGDISTPYSPAPEDFQTTSLSPSSLSNLQLYNRPLLKDELLQNAESEGLKELKEGVPVQDGLVLHYDFSNESNTSEYKGKAFDYSGNGNHGVLNNFNYTAESGYDENKLLFDGVDDYIHADKFDLSGDFTIDFTFEVLSNENRETLVYLTETTQDSSSYVFLVQTSRIRYWTEPSKAASGINITKFSAGLGLQNLSIVYEGGILKIYRNGLLDSSDIIDFNLNSQGFFLGRYDSNTDRFSGVYHSSKVYNRPLSPEEIAHNYAIEKERFGIE